VVAWNVLSSSVGRNRNIHVNSEICTSPFLNYRDLKTCRLPWKWIRLPPKQQAQNKTNPDLKSRRYFLSYKRACGELGLPVNSGMQSLCGHGVLHPGTVEV